MCLDSIRGKGKKVSSLKGVGWRLFRLSSSKRLKSLYKGNFKPFRINRWLYEEDFRDPNEYEKIKINVLQQCYTTGFHIFLDKEWIPERWYKSYRDRRIRKVKYRNVTCIGTQDGCMVVVARQMLIVPKKRRTK